MRRLAEHSATSLKGYPHRKDVDFTVGTTSHKVRIVKMIQSDIYERVWSPLRSDNMATLLGTRLRELKVQLNDSSNLVIISDTPHEGPHSQYFPPVMTLLQLDDGHRHAAVVVHGNNMGDLAEIQSLLAAVVWKDISQAHPPVPDLL